MIGATRYGCFNRAALHTHIIVRDGWVRLSGRGVLQAERRIEDPMTKECQYSIDAKDARCAGCLWDRAAEKR